MIAVLSPSAVCGCRECRMPTLQNADTRLVHAERHRDFSARVASQPTAREIRMWRHIRNLHFLAETEPVA